MHRETLGGSVLSLPSTPVLLHQLLGALHSLTRA